jgi:mono/diheme cytochrome c family protein
MTRSRLIWIVGVVAVVAVGWFAFSKMANRALPEPEPVTRVVTLNQGWSSEEAAQYHYTAQGTFLLPLAWIESLEAGFFSSKKLVDPTLLRSARFLTDGVEPDPKTNPAGLPIGWAAASWTPPSVNSVRTSSDLPESRNVGFACAACHTGQLNYKGVGIRIDGAGALMDTDSFEVMVGKAIISTAILPWKRGRFIREVSRRTGAKPEKVSEQLDHMFGEALEQARISLFKPLYTPAAYGRLDALQRIANTLMADDLKQSSNNRPGDGPVKFPYLWDAWRLDWVQYNGSVRQPMMRNVGESLGVEAQTNFVDKAGKANPEPARWNSSVQVANLFWMESALERLRAPVWPGDVLPPIQADRARAGRALFDAKCAGCHGIHVDTAATPVEWKVTMVAIDKIGTDPNQQANFIKNTYSAEKLGLGSLTGAEALKAVTTKVKDYQYDRDKLTPEQRSQWDGHGRAGEVRSPAAYKARPLVGIWASPPYLHNGAAPTLYDLLSPERPKRFIVARRAYDAVKVGYDTTPVRNGAVFDTTQPGNSNKGHWFADDARPGRIGAALSEADRYALIEYLKAATYADYPCTDAATGKPLTGAVCGDVGPSPGPSPSKSAPSATYAPASGAGRR